MKIPASKIRPRKIEITVDKFKGGTNTLIDEARMSSEFAVESNNMLQTQDGVWTTKWGSAYYGKDHASTIDGACEFVKSDGTTELITISNGKVWKSTDGGALTEVTGATFTAGLQCYFLQISGYLYIANGTDTLARYDGTNLTSYTEISAPANLSASLVGLSSGSFTQYAQVTALNDVGETVGSTEASISVNKDRDNWNSSTDKVVWSWDSVANANRYQLYISDESGDEALLTSTIDTNYTDNGSLDINTYVVVPEDNTTGAPKFKSMCMSGNRIWATNDSDSKYKVYFSGTGQYLGNFSDFYGGGWINLEKGGREMPIVVRHYQTGSGSGVATALCKTPDGRGAIWQIDISTATVGDTSFSIPSATKVIGSFGTESILGTVATDNDLMFPNRKGWFSLGPEKNYYGILRTRELSSNIRPSWRNLISSKISSICAYYYDAKVFISVPNSTSGNDTIAIYDMERRNWSWSWNNGARQFLDYTDTSGNTHFLYVPMTGTKLIELSENYANDLGSAFNQSYISPLIPVSKHKTDMLVLKDAVLELGRPKGSISFKILGIGKDNSFTTIGSTTIDNFGASTGVGSDLVGDFFMTSTNDNSKGGAGSWAVYYTQTPSTFTQAITKKAIKKRAKLYAIQFKVSSTTADTSYSILSLQARGTLVSRRVPSDWVS